MLLQGLPISKLKISEAEERYIIAEGNLLNDIPNMDHYLYERSYDIEVLQNASILTYAKPSYFNRAWNHFCSHRQAPIDRNAKRTPIIVEGENEIFIAAPLFTDYAKNGYLVHKDIIRQCIDRLMTQPIVKTNLPSTSEIAVRKQGRDIIIHVLNYSIQRKSKSIDTIECKQTVVDKEICIKTLCPPKNVLKIPEKKELTFEYQDGYTILRLDKLAGHDMFVIQI